MVPGGSANGDRLSSLGSIGEYTVVASANRGVRGAFSDVSETVDAVRSLLKGVGRLFSFMAEVVGKPLACLACLIRPDTH